MDKEYALTKAGSGNNKTEEITDGESDWPGNASRAFEKILRRVGDYHKYQWKLTVIVAMCGMFTPLHNKGAVFLAASPDHWCDIPYYKEHNLTVEKSGLNLTAPWERGKYGELEPSKCKYNDLDYASLETTYNNFSYAVQIVEPGNLSIKLEEKTCDSWMYDDSIYESTVVTEWDLVCKNRWMMSLVQASYMMGILAGAVIFSAISDKIGRRPASLICCCLFIVSSVSTAFSRSFIIFLILRFITAGSGQGMYLVNYILVIETVSLKGRNIMGNLARISFSVGTIMLSVYAYFFNDWRHLQLVISIPTGILLLYFWVLPESPRWLLMHGREKEGVELLKTIAKCNAKEFPSDEELLPLLKVISEEVKEYNMQQRTVTQKLKSIWGDVVTLVRTPNMRRRNLITFYGWFVTSMVFYGLTFSGANLNASLYVTVGMSGIIGVLTVITTIFVLTKIGRRTIVCISFFIGGVASFSIIFVPKEIVWLNLSLALLGYASSVCTFVIVFMLSAELVPTHVRNISIGIASMWARIGSGLAPFIVDLLGDVYYAIPSTIFGVLTIIAGLLSLLLPETGKKRLPESVEEIEAMPR